MRNPGQREPIYYNRRGWARKPVYWRIVTFWWAFVLVGMAVLLAHFLMEPEVHNADFSGNLMQWESLHPEERPELKTRIATNF